MLLSGEEVLTMAVEVLAKYIQQLAEEYDIDLTQVNGRVDLVKRDKTVEVLDFTMDQLVEASLK